MDFNGENEDETEDGDRDFREFLEKQQNEMSTSEFAVFTTNNKLDRLIELFKASTDIYNSITDNPKFRNKVILFIDTIMDKALESIKMYDYVILRELDDEEGDNIQDIDNHG